MCALGMADEFKDEGIAINALWPRTAIQTAAVAMLMGESSALYSRKPEIVADAAYAILCKDPRAATGKFFIDDEILKAEGITDFVQYACHPENADKLVPDAFLDVSSSGAFAALGSKKPAEAGDGGQIVVLFQKIEKLLCEPLVEKVQAVYHFNVKGDEAGIWYLDLKNGAGRCGKGDGGLQPDATLTMEAKNFFDMFAGKLKPASAFMTGKLKISGDLQKAMKLEKLMAGLKSKL